MIVNNLLNKAFETAEILIQHHIQIITIGLEPVNDGKQTPMRGHPVLIAQHATATC